MPYVVDVTGRGLATSVLARRGIVALLLVAAVVAVLLMQYRGAFRAVFPAVALVTDVGDGVQTGADVKLRGALVGTVGGVRVRPEEQVGGLPLHEIDLRLRPAMAAGIPAGVTARVVPTNVFGAPAVELLDPPRPSGRTLAPGAVIPGDTSEATLRLQTVLNQLTKVLRAVHPARLNVALTNLAQGLRGRGGKLGSIISRLDPYLTTLNGHTEEFSADLRLLGTDLDALAAVAPELLDTVDNAVVTSQTVVAERDRLAATLTGGADTAEDLDEFLSDNDERIIRLTRDGAGIAGVLAPQHRLITSSLFSLASGAERLAGAADPRRQGGLSLLFTLSPFAPYTAADCPRYPGLAGPNCGGSTGTPPELSPLFQGVPVPPLPFAGSSAPTGPAGRPGAPAERPSAPTGPAPVPAGSPPGPAPQAGEQDLLPGMFPSQPGGTR